MRSYFFFLAVAAVCAVETFAAPLGSGFTYQGRLNDGGAPANGNYDMVFNLYDDPTNGNVLGTFSIFGAVPVTNGLFTVELNAYGEFGTNAFNGQARWLQMGVRTNKNSILNRWINLSPRQPLNCAPQAMFAQNASSADNASIAATVPDGAITGSKLANGSVQANNLAAGAVSWDAITGIPAGFADGVDNGGTYTAGAGLSLNGANQFSVNFAGAGTADSAARSDHNHFGANWSGASSGYGLTVINHSTTGIGLYSQQGTGSGTAAPIGYKAAVWGESSQGDAVYGASGSASGAGVYGYATSASGANYGVYGQSDSPNGVGVLAKGSGANGTALRISNGAIRVTGAGPSSTAPVFIHEITTNNVVSSPFSSTIIWSVIDKRYCNNAPDAILTVTGYLKNDPNNSFFPPWPVPVSVYYNGNANHGPPRHWLLHASVGQLELGQRYNVMVINP